MPTYDYACQDCGGFDAFRTVGARNEPAACPVCSGASPRVLATAPRLALMDSGIRNAMVTNERAQHAPRMSGASGDYSRLKHPAGCGCCSTSKRGATLQAPNGNKVFPSKRPWMISH